MTVEAENFLYRHPAYYDMIYPKVDPAVAKMSLRMFSRYCPIPPSSILDVGCGTGSDLAYLSDTCSECWGVDTSAKMIAFARNKYPQLCLQTGDMRCVRLERTFDAILCVGSAFSYALSNDDVDRTLQTCTVHAHPGTLLILDVWNAASFLGHTVFDGGVPFRIDTPEFSATGLAVYAFDYRRQTLIRRRTWTISGSDAIEDFCQYRLFFPVELEHLLIEKTFQVVGMFDNVQLVETDFSGSRLYVAAVKV